MSENKPEWLIEYQERLADGRLVSVSYDREGDILELFFDKGPGCGIELADEIVLRYNVETGEPLSLMFLSFSRLIQPTDYGPESFRLTGLERLPADRRRIVMRILTSPPVNHYLRVSALSLLHEQKPVPITYVRPPMAVAA